MRVLPESWTPDVASLVRQAAFPPETARPGAPALLWARDYLPQQANHWAAFNIRARHFRCQETWFVQEEDGAPCGAVALEGLRSHRPVAAVNLVVGRVAEDGVGRALNDLLCGVLAVARRYAPLTRLRFSYPFDPLAGVPVNVRACRALLDPDPALPLHEEARISNETGRGRELVMLAFRHPKSPEEAQCENIE